MKRNYDYVQNYIDAYQAMRKKAIQVIKDYGKEFDLIEYAKKRLKEELDGEVMEEDIDDWLVENSYSCVLVGKHGTLYPCTVMKARYNDKTETIEVYLSSDDGYINEWFSDYDVDYEKDAVYQTILNFID